LNGWERRKLNWSWSSKFLMLSWKLQTLQSKIKISFKIDWPN
jgi:hypothetical protein